LIVGMIIKIRMSCCW